MRSIRALLFEANLFQYKFHCGLVHAIENFDSNHWYQLRCRIMLTKLIFEYLISSSFLHLFIDFEKDNA